MSGASFATAAVRSLARAYGARLRLTRTTPGALTYATDTRAADTTVTYRATVTIAPGMGRREQTPPDGGVSQRLELYVVDAERAPAVGDTLTVAQGTFRLEMVEPVAPDGTTVRAWRAQAVR